MPDPEGLWLVRHGETAWSVSGRHTSRSDVPLTATGEQEARNLSGALGAHSFQLVLSSPRQRAGAPLSWPATAPKSTTTWPSGTMETWKGSPSTK